MTELQNTIEAAWENRSEISSDTTGEIRDAIDTALGGLDNGSFRVAEKQDGEWIVNQWLKKAVLLSFRLNDMALNKGGVIDDVLGESTWYDKVPSKLAGWTKEDFQNANFRAVPGAIIRKSSYIAPNAVVMPSFVNMGAYVDEGTMVDSWVTVGSCSQIGKNVHLSEGVCVGGVLEPLQANPVIIEDNCFIGSKTSIVEGIIVETGAVIAMGTMLSQSTKIVDRETGEISYGRIPAYSVVVPGTLPAKPLADGSPAPSLNCAVIIKKVNEKTRAKVSINELLRD
jgi:2,3,4,5-tetrahydropyridine-2-carboxylate N-succinyltransferase